MVCWNTVSGWGSLEESNFYHYHSKAMLIFYIKAMQIRGPYHGQ